MVYNILKLNLRSQHKHKIVYIHIISYNEYRSYLRPDEDAVISKTSLVKFIHTVRTSIELLQRIKPKNTI